MAKPWFYWQDNILFIHVYLQPRASADNIIGVHDDALKIRLTSPPLEGRANKHLIKYLAKCCKVPEMRVSIVKGELGRKKWVSIDTPSDVSILNENRTGK